MCCQTCVNLHRRPAHAFRVIRGAWKARELLYRPTHGATVELCAIFLHTRCTIIIDLGFIMVAASFYAKVGHVVDKIVLQVVPLHHRGGDVLDARIG